MFWIFWIFWIFWEAFIQSLQNFQNFQNFQNKKDLNRKECVPVLLNLLCKKRNGNVAEFRQCFKNILYMPRPRQLPFAGQRREVGAVCFRKNSIGRRKDGSGVNASRIWIGDGPTEGKIKP